MSSLIAAAYPDDATAESVVSALGQYSAAGSGVDCAVCSVTIAGEGSIRIRQRLTRCTVETAIEQLVVSTLGGLAVGAAYIGRSTRVADIGIDDQFVRDLGDQLHAGGSAIFLLVRSASPDSMLASVAQYGGTLLHTIVTPAAEQQLVGA